MCQALFMTGVCKSSQGCFFYWHKYQQKAEFGGGRRGAHVAFQNRRFRLHRRACMPELHVHTCRQRTARQHSIFFQDLAITHQCKIFYPQNHLSCKHPELNRSVSDNYSLFHYLLSSTVVGVLPSAF